MKKHLKRNFTWRLKKIVQATFQKHEFSRAKIWLPNLYFHQFVCNKRPIRSKKHAKKMFTYRVRRKSLEPFLRHRLLQIFRFLQNLEVLSIHLSSTVYKIWCFYLYQFQRYKELNIPFPSHTYTQTNFQKTLFWIQGTSEHINQVKSRYRKF